MKMRVSAKFCSLKVFLGSRAFVAVSFVATSFIIGAPGPSRAEDSGNVYGFMRSEWQRTPQRQPFYAPQRVATIPPAALQAYEKPPLSFSVRPRKTHRARVQLGKVRPDDALKAKVTGEVTYCVRLCDGFYLPMTYSSASSGDKAAKTCADMWPAAETAVYKSWDMSSGIEAAKAVKGNELYTALPAAYAYRNQGGGAVNSCSADQLAEKQHQIWNDATLKKGDIFVSESGPVIFSGRGRPPYAEKDFSPVDKAYSKLSKDVRLLVEAVKASGSGTH